MSIKDKKEAILNKLQSTNDEELIDEVYDLLNANDSIQEIKINNLPEELRNKIMRGLEDYKNGRYITHEQMKQKVNEWLTS
jgi:hypothetical protein